MIIFCFLIFFSSNWEGNKYYNQLDSLISVQDHLTDQVYDDPELYGSPAKINYYYAKGIEERSLGENKSALVSFQNGLTSLGPNVVSEQAFDFYRYLCMVTRDLSHFELSTEYVRAARNIAEELGDDNLLYKSFILESNIYNNQNVPDSALHYIALARKYVGNKDYYKLGTIENNLAILNIEKGSYHLAYNQFEKAEKNFISDGQVSTQDINQVLINKATCMLYMENLEICRKLMTKAYHLAEENDFRGQLSDLINLRIRYLAKKNKIEEIANLMEMNDALLHESIDSTVYDLSIKYNVQFKDSIISNQDEVIVMKEEALTEQSLIAKNRKRGLISLSIVFAVAALFFAMYSKNQKVQHQLSLSNEIIKKHQALQAERSRIAAEMHDDLGSGLTKIKFLSQRMLKNINDIEQKSKLTKIIDNSQSLVSNMSEIIWAMNSGFDSVESVVAYCRRYAKEYLTDHEIELVYENLMGSERNEFTGERRRHLFLVFKELLHNIVKHSEASLVKMQWQISGDEILLSISDNGVGIDQEEWDTGNGLNNMRQRISELNGTIAWVAESGTRTQISIPIAIATELV